MERRCSDYESSPSGGQKQYENDMFETYGTLFSINLTFSNKISAKSVQTLLRKWRFSDVMSGDLGSKIGQHSNVSRMRAFKVKRKHQTPQDVK